MKKEILMGKRRRVSRILKVAFSRKMLLLWVTLEIRMATLLKYRSERHTHFSPPESAHLSKPPTTANALEDQSHVLIWKTFLIVNFRRSCSDRNIIAYNSRTNWSIKIKLKYFVFVKSLIAWVPFLKYSGHVSKLLRIHFEILLNQSYELHVLARP